MSTGAGLQVTVTLNGDVQTFYGANGQGINWTMTPDQMRQHIRACTRACEIATGIQVALAAEAAEKAKPAAPALAAVPDATV